MPASSAFVDFNKGTPGPGIADGREIRVFDDVPERLR
jgi:hypothetical protein